MLDKPRSSDAASKLFEIVDVASQEVLMETIGNPAESIHCMVNGISAGVGLLSKLLSPKCDTMRARPDDETMIIACLLVSRMAHHSADGRGVDCQYDILAIKEALDDFEKLTGKKPDDFVRPVLLKAINDSDALELFEQARQERAKLHSRTSGDNVVEFPRRLH